MHLGSTRADPSEFGLVLFDVLEQGLLHFVGQHPNDLLALIHFGDNTTSAVWGCPVLRKWVQMSTGEREEVQGPPE